MLRQKIIYVLLVMSAVYCGGGQSFAQTDEPEQFQKLYQEMGEIKEYMGKFSNQIEGFETIIEKIIDLDTAKDAEKEVEELRKMIEHIQGKLANDSSVEQLLKDIQKWVEDGLINVLNNPRLDPKHKTSLKQEYEKRQFKIQEISKDIDNMREVITKSLEIIRGHEAYLVELGILGLIDQIISSTEDFLKDMVNFSTELQNRINKLVPGS